MEVKNEAKPDTNAETNTEEIEDCTPELTLEAIENIEDVLDAFDLADSNNIDIDGLENIEQIKQRLKCHFRLQKGSPKDEMVTKISRLGEIDKFKRDQLAAMVNQVKKRFPDQSNIGAATQQHLMEDLLLKDGTTENIRKDCDARIESLKAKESVILVAGESSAGKSSLLNLLIGEEILPSHMLPCTSCITVIRYNPYRCARILNKDGEITQIKTLDKQGLEELQSRAYFHKGTTPSEKQKTMEKRKEGHDIAEIQVFLPLDLLKSGLVLVDTPGVGENEFLENYLIDYIYNRQILGFMYIVMTDSAMGVAEDRLVNLMSLIIKSQRNNSDIIKFDPHAALFVCNRWDMVPEESRDTVKASVIRQLGKCWPEFDESKAVFFSTYKAEQETLINPGYITVEYINLLMGIQKLVEVSLDRRIKASYKWLGTVIQRCMHYLKTIIRRMDMSNRDRQKKTENANKKLKTLRSKANTVVERLKENAEDGIKNICTRVRDYLQSPQARMKLTKGWGKKEGELPDIEYSCVTWDWLKRRIEMAFNDRLSNLLEEWDAEEKKICTLEKQLFRDAKLQLCDLESDLNELENQVQGDNNSRTSTMGLLNSYCKTLDETYEHHDWFEESDVSEKIIHRLFRYVTKKGKQRQETQKVRAYIEKPAHVAEQRVHKLLDKILKRKDDSLEEFVREMFVRPFSFINKLERKIPNMITSNMMLLEKFEKEILDKSKSQNDYLKTMEQVEELRSDLIKYGEGHFFANDFSEEDIELVFKMQYNRLIRKISMADLMKRSPSTAEMDSFPDPHGLWHVVYLGKVVREGRKGEYVSVKIYNRGLQLENSTKEVAKLRCLLHTDVCVAEFLGVYQRKDPPVPAYIFQGKLVSLKLFMTNNVDADEMKFMVDILAGLQYIHSKGLVHVDLTKDTVTVDETGNIKLTGACLPRKVEVPTMAGIRTQAFVYIAPEVLKGHIYISKADMYSFALLALEIRDWKYLAFEEHRNTPIMQFVNFKHATILEPTILSSTFHHSMKKKLLRCVDSDMEVRLSALDMSTEFQLSLRSSSLVRKTATATPRHLWQAFSLKKR